MVKLVSRDLVVILVPKDQQVNRVLLVFQDLTETLEIQVQQDRRVM